MNKRRRYKAKAKRRNARLGSGPGYNRMGLTELRWAFTDVLHGLAPGSPLTVGAGQTGKTLTIEDCVPVAYDKQLGISIRFVQQYDIHTGQPALRVHADGRVEDLRK